MRSFAKLGIIGAIAIVSFPLVVGAVTASNPAVTCTNDADCRDKWQRAKEWVRSHSEWPIKTANETLIETEKQRFRNYSSLYYKITRGQQDGKTVIRFEAGCLPSVRCNPEPSKAREDFNRFVDSGE